MEIFMSVVLGDLTSRSINFIINKYFSNSPELTVENSLQRALLRAQVIIGEAMGRHITNHAMLLQLIMLRDAMHRGHYMLDTFKYQPHDEEAEDQAVSHSSSLHIINSVKHLCFSNRVPPALKELQETLDNLNSTILDVNELVLFLMSCPRLYCQPYSMHLQLANCMFGRQMEAELVLNFLLHPRQSHGAEELDVMPIIGLGQVGKSTLVTHVCKDERVHAYFSEIVLFHIQGFTDDEETTFREECARKHQGHVLNSNKNMRFLVVIELIGDLNEDAWNRLHSASKCFVPSGSKIIITSRFDTIAKFGTTEALFLKPLPHEAYWYFFKTLTFGSMDPEMHPRFMQVAMEIARTQRGSMIGANILARLLRVNFDAHFWLKVLAFWRGYFKKHITRFGEHPFELLKQNMIARLGRMNAPSEDFVVCNQYQLSSEQDVPKIRIEDVLHGSVKPHGKFEVLAWKSRIPPYYSHVYSCDIQELQTRAVKRKRSTKSRVRIPGSYC